MDKAGRKHLGSLVRVNRKRLRLSQAKLGELIGNVTHNTISNIERGNTIPTLYTLSALSKVLDVPLWRFVTPEMLIPAPDAPDEAAIMAALPRLDEQSLRTLRDMVDVFTRVQK